MNPSVAVVAALLVSASTFFSTVQAHADPSLCCFTYTAKPVPLKLLASYEHTNSQCSLPAVIFTTKAQRRVCADPQAAWTKERIQRL